MTRSKIVTATKIISGFSWVYVCIISASFLIGIMNSGCTTVRQFGIQDSVVERQIQRANDMASRYKNKDYLGIEKRLKSDLENYSGDSYAVLHILNELADLYSYHLLDIENAIKTDQQVLKIGTSAVISSSYRIDHDAANNNVLVAKEYRDAFLNIASETVIKDASRRLLKNQALLKGVSYRPSREYGKSELETMHSEVTEDLSRTYPGTAEYFILRSRLMRIEYELYRSTGHSSDVLQDGWKPLLSGEMKLSDIFFSEIDFLALADYMGAAYKKTGDIRLARFALEMTYRPYMNMRNSENRWLYNKLVNNRINTLIKGHFETSDFTSMLYYITLNKSRMVLEDKLRLVDSPGNISSQHNEYYDEATGLPSLAMFNAKLAKASAYLDFYLDGHYTEEDKTQPKRKDIQHKSESVLEGTSKTRRIAISEKTGSAFDSDYLYVTYLDGSKITAKRYDHSILKQLQQGLDKQITLVCDSMGEESRDSLNICRRVSTTDTSVTGQKVRRISAVKKSSDNRSSKTTVKNTNEVSLASLVDATLPADLTVSTDGWLSWYPMSYHLDKNVVMTLNLFTFGHPDSITHSKIAGYFNPTGDLPEADQEKAFIARIFPNSNLYTGEQASLENLRKTIERNIIHLSMHGDHFSDAPEKSLLAFAGSVKTKSLGQSRRIAVTKKLVDKSEANSKKDILDSIESIYNLDHALLVGEMASIGQLKNNDLVFTAACRTGLTEKADSNESEVMGIMRPLLINNNKNIILTLWDVPTQSAALFVQSFYENLSNSNNIRSSFFAARNLVRSKYSEPVHWAPYYLVQTQQ